jgi:hypothetical protein
VAIKKPRLQGDDYFRIMAATGTKNVDLFKGTTRQAGKSLRLGVGEPVMIGALRFSLSVEPALNQR